MAAIFAAGGLLVFSMARTMLTDDILTLEKGFATEIRSLVRLTAENSFNRYLDLKSAAVAERKRRIQQACRGALVGISLLHSLENAGDMTGEQARKKALAWVKSRTFGPDASSVFILDHDLTALAVKDPGLEGRKWTGFPNLKGQDAFELVGKTVRETGSASSVFWWADRDGGQKSKRMGMFFAFPQWDWIVGTMVDMEELEKIDGVLREKAVQELASDLSGIHYGDKGRLFIVDKTGRVLLNPWREGTAASGMTGNAAGWAFPEEVLRSAQGTGQPVEYRWPNPVTGEPERQIAFVEHFKPFDLNIALIASMDELTRPGDKLALVQAVIAFGVLMLGLCALYPILLGISKPLKVLSEEARELPRGNFSRPGQLAMELDTLAEGATTEVADLAKGFRFMLQELATHLQAISESQAMLTYLNRTLEQRVDDRTKDLELANSRLQAEIAERIATAEQMIQAKDEALEASKAKSQFLANMSHEIRTPITSILGLAELSLLASSRGKEGHYSRQIIQSTRDLLALVNDILDLSRVEAGKITLEKIPFAPRETIDFALGRFQAACREKGLSFFVRWEGNLPGRLLGDPLRLSQVLGNLVGNAVKFTRKGSVTVTIGPARPCGDGRIEIQAAVADTGPGIAPEQKEKVFEAFHQADSGYSKSHQGSGLGLAICRELTALMGGSVWVEAGHEGGSVFFFTARFESAPAQTQEALPQPSAGAVHGRRLRILLAEDNALNRGFFEEFLESLGHQVLSVEDGQAALDALVREEVDLILMDVQMPRLDGLEATRRIRAGECGPRAAAAPIVALTASAMLGDRERLLQAGMNHYLSKPVKLDTLQGAVEMFTQGPDGDPAPE
ncbi:cache domain-containing protein [Fundidesulfovibrio terrae]|uniref:cache domain-containing protein n=1 Tax=Fundidesulfovibrio terrae TaxID=2922866 RepID=UPI001FB00306